MDRSVTQSSNRPSNQDANRRVDREERPASAENAEKETPAPPATVIEDSEALTAMKEAFRDGMVAGLGLVLGIAALAHWAGFSASPSFLDALWSAMPLAFVAMVVGGAVQCLRGALRLGEEQPEGKGWGFSEALVAVGAVMAVMARDFLMEAKEDGKDTMRFGAIAIVVVAAAVFLLLVFAPSVLEEIRRAVARSF